MKIKQRIIFLISSLVICLTLSSCVDPPIGHTYMDSVNRYPEFNSYTTEILKKEFSGSLPEKILDEKQVINYRFDYSCALFGDPNFLIDLKMTYDDVWSKNVERERLNSLLKDEPISIDQKEYYVFQGDLNALKMYVDDEIHDGLCIFFELVIIDQEQTTIEYISAMQQDNKGKIDELFNHAKAIVDYYAISEK